MKNTIYKNFLRLFLLLIASYGFFYYSYKFYQPYGGGVDFFEYYKIYVNPLDFDEASSPFVFRQLSAIFVNFFYEIGVYYSSDIFFINKNIDQRVYFSAIFVNYLFLVFTSWLVGFVAIDILNKLKFSDQLMAGFLCFMSFHSLSNVLTGLTEGVSWALIVIGFLFYIRNYTILTVIIVFLSVFQRETIIIFFGALSFFSIIFRRKIDTHNLTVLICSVIAFFCYITVRILSGATGYEGQLSYVTIINNFLSFSVGSDLIKQGFLSQNILVMTTILFFICAFRCKNSVVNRDFLCVLMAGFVIFLFCIAAGIGNNIGRVFGVITPILAVYFVVYLNCIE